MPQNFLACDRDQQYLMPPSLRDWLPADHLTWFVVDAVAQMDLSAFYARYREDGWGRAAYEPSMMVALTLYSYCLGERSSRRIERRCHEDVAYRVVAANQTPDHATIARFRQMNEEALAGLFAECLRLCAGAGLGKVGVVAVDGTKMGAAAALSANRPGTRSTSRCARCSRRLRRWTRQRTPSTGRACAETSSRPSCATARAASRASRRPSVASTRRTPPARRRSEKAHEQRLAERERIERERGQRLRGRKPKPPAPDPAARANTTDPESRIVKTRQGYLQGYNGQAAVGEDQIILAAELTQDENDVGQLHLMIGATERGLHEAGIAHKIGAIVADAGYMSDQNLKDHDPAGPELLIATTSRPTRRAAHKEKGAPRGRIPTDATPRQRMERTLLTKRGQALYRRRAQIVEPVFGQIKDPRGIRRFMRRGLAACQSEWKLIAATHNLLKLFRHGPSAPARPSGSLGQSPAAA